MPRCRHNGTHYVWQSAVPGAHGPRQVLTGCPWGVSFSRVRGLVRHIRHLRRLRVPA